MLCRPAPFLIITEESRSSHYFTRGSDGTSDANQDIHQGPDMVKMLFGNQYYINDNGKASSTYCTWNNSNDRSILIPCHSRYFQKVRSILYLQRKVKNKSDRECFSYVCIIPRSFLLESRDITLLLPKEGKSVSPTCI